MDVVGAGDVHERLARLAPRQTVHAGLPMRSLCSAFITRTVGRDNANAPFVLDAAKAAIGPCFLPGWPDDPRSRPK
jgi:hypothetical protein